MCVYTFLLDFFYKIINIGIVIYNLKFPPYIFSSVKVFILKNSCVLVADCDAHIFIAIYTSQLCTEFRSLVIISILNLDVGNFY